MPRTLSTALVLALSLTGLARADVRLPKIFGSHMVLQRGVPVPVWGWADAGEQVTVEFRGQSQSATADANGQWSLKLEALDVGDAATLTVSGNNTLTLEDVLVGEVWICSGQSNMQWSVSASRDPDLESAATNHPQLRLFYVPRVAKPEPQADVEAAWTTCTPETVSQFSAVGYFFGRQLQETLGVPVGVIHTSWGGTRAEAWATPDVLAGSADLQPILDVWNQRVAAFDPAAAEATYQTALKEWEDKAAAARAAGTAVPNRPQSATPPNDSQHHYSTLYNAMIAPLVPYAIRGAIWYQGESNAGRAAQYRTLLPAMIQSWRNVWHQGDFPFYIVQLANHRAIQDQPGDSSWAELREAQMLAADALPNVGVACITDLGAALDIHPRNKQDVARRLARLALVDYYGHADRVARSGPTYTSLDIQGSKCVVHFNNGGSDLTSWYKEPLRGFAIAGADQKWHWAEAKVSGPSTVELSSSNVPEPLAVRYNWADNPQGNLYNGRDLPAYPFRTDDWPLTTAGKLAPE
jgi:sialate O-acetylesterase